MCKPKGRRVSRALAELFRGQRERHRARIALAQHHLVDRVLRGDASG